MSDRGPSLPAAGDRTSSPRSAGDRLRLLVSAASLAVFAACTTAGNDDSGSAAATSSSTPTASESPLAAESALGGMASD